jgi:hypothetical protein
MYNLTMSLKVLNTLLMPRFTADTKTFFGMSSIIKMGLRHTDSEVKSRINTFLTEPIFTVSDLDKQYRIISYLDKTGLIDDTRSEKGKGWRKLGLSEYIYISILLELRKYGLKSDCLKQFKSLYDEYFTYAIYAVLAGHEVTIIFKHDGFCALLDPTFLSIYEEEDRRFKTVTPQRGAGEIQLKLSHFVSNALLLIGKPAPIIQHSFAKSISVSKELKKLREYEKKLLIKIRQLEHTKDEELFIKRLYDGSLLIKHGESLPGDDDFVSKLSALVEEDFCDLNFVKRDGKAAHLEITRTEKLSTI